MKFKAAAANGTRIRKRRRKRRRMRKKIRKEWKTRRKRGKEGKGKALSGIVKRME